MKIGYLLLVPILFISACNHKTADNTTARDHSVIKHSFHSKIMGEERSYTVFHPLNRNGIKNTKPLPVLFILDGPRYFSFFKALLEQWTSKKEVVLPEMIVVAIKQNNRSSELLPTYIDSNGNGDAFLLHIEKELIPAIEADYNVLSHRTLFGHSRAGLFTLNTLLEKPDLFDNYIISDPSLTLGESGFVKKWDSLQISLFDHKNSLFVGLADTKEGYPLEYVLSDDSDAFPHMRTIWSFCEKLEQDSIKNKNFKWKYYDEFGHNTIPTMVAIDGLLSVFDYYRLDKYGLIYSHLNGLINYGTFKQSISDHFHEVSDRMGLTVLPFEELLFEYGEIFLEEDMNEKAIEMFQWNVDNYPESIRSKKMLVELAKNQ